MADNTAIQNCLLGIKRKLGLLISKTIPDINKDNSNLDSLSNDILIHQIENDVDNVIILFNGVNQKKILNFLWLLICIVFGLLLGVVVTIYFVTETVNNYQIENVTVILLNYLGINNSL